MSPGVRKALHAFVWTVLVAEVAFIASYFVR